MSRALLGVICGLVFGAIDIGIMLPMSFPDKKAAITAAFIARFGIGFVIGAARLPWPGWLVGLFFGLLLSIPDAIITKAYGPIIGMGQSAGLSSAQSSVDSDAKFFINAHACLRRQTGYSILSWWVVAQSWR